MLKNYSLDEEKTLHEIAKRVLLAQEHQGDVYIGMMNSALRLSQKFIKPQENPLDKLTEGNRF